MAEDPIAAGWYGRQTPVELSAQTAVLEVTPNPWGSPSGPGLWKHKGLRLPAYVEQVSKGIMKSGRAASESEAIQVAIGVLKRWAAGGGKVTPEVRAAAAKAIAEWEALKAGAHFHANDGARRVIDLVGPHGFVHGWIFVGVPGAGARVFHPQLGAGTVTGHDSKHATVRFDRGGVTKSFEARAGKAGEAAKLAPRAEAPAYVKDFRNPATAAADELMRQALQDEDYAGVAKQLLVMDKLEAKAGVPADAPVRVKLAGSLRHVKAVQWHRQREDRALQKERERQASRIGGARSGADAPESPFTIIRKQSGKGWAVREEGQPGWVHTSPTKQGAQDYADRVTQQRAALAASEAEGNARTAALLKSRGIGPVDYRNLQPGDQFTWDPAIPPKTVLRVQHLASGASLITWEKGAHTPKGENQTLMTPGHKAYGRLSGHSHAGDAPAVDLAGVFTEALHPRAGGRFASKGGGKVTAARQRHGANTPAVQRPPAAGPGQTRAQQLRYQAAQDRHLAGQIMVKVAGLVRARDAAIAGLPASHGKTASVTSAAAKATAAASPKAHPQSAAAKAKAAATRASSAPKSRVATLDGQIKLLRRDARLLIQSANHLDQQASGL